MVRLINYSKLPLGWMWGPATNWQPVHGVPLLCPRMALTTSSNLMTLTGFRRGMDYLMKEAHLFMNLLLSFLFSSILLITLITFYQADLCKDFKTQACITHWILFRVTRLLEPMLKPNVCLLLIAEFKTILFWDFMVRFF